MQAYEQPPALPSSPSPQKRKRGPRATIACESCRRLKAKCDQRTPCCVCIKLGSSLECIYRSTGSNSSRMAAQQTRRRISGGVLVGETKGQAQHGGSQGHAQRTKLSNTSAASNINGSGSTDNPRFTVIAARPPAQRSLSRTRPLSSPQNADVANVSEMTHSAIPEDEDYEGKSARSDTHQEEIGVTQVEADPSPNGFGEVNTQTNGTEFYGPTAALAFLLELRARARSFQSQNSQSKNRFITERSERRELRNLSIVDFFHGGEDAVPDAPDQVSPDSGYLLHEHAAAISPSSSNASYHAAPNIELEKECIKLYFANLHLIYLILDKEAFMARCETEIWSPDTALSKRSSHRKSSRFPALYNAVVAVGVITAGDDTLIAQNLGRVQRLLDDRSNQLKQPSCRKRAIYPPLELAQRYFAKARALLGDFVEVCSLESTQTLFLMSIFCQYALKPHGCYMYSGMSARTALAIGIANEPDLKKTSLEAIRTWWCMYYHEIEVCCSLGRETFLREPAYYPVFMAKFGDPMPSEYAHPSSEDTFFARSMTELAHILNRASEEIYHTASTVSRVDKSQAALNLDDSIVHWKSQLSPMFSLDSTSLTEPESVTKRKVVLKLRYYSARILIHRPFLVAAAYQGSSASFGDNIKLCLDAARETVHLLYDTFVNRPFFRTWWYNTTYAFSAITIILYALVSHLQKGSREELLKDVEMTLKIFQAMDGITVARRCAELTQEIFEIAKISLEDQRDRNQAAQCEDSLNPPRHEHAAPVAAPQSHPDRGGWGDFVSPDGFHEDFFASLIDPNILDTFGANLDGLGLDVSTYENFDSMADYGI